MKNSHEHQLTGSRSRPGIKLKSLVDIFLRKITIHKVLELSTWLTRAH